MRITKYEHATLVLEKDGSRLVIDPGMFLAGLTDLSDIVGVVVTHEHPDHWSAENLAAIRSANPGVPVLGPAGFTHAAEGIETTTIAPGETATAGPFTLRFFGGKHALIHASVPVIENVGVLVDDAFYYPGDSYAVPEDVRVQVLAAPAAAPWLRIGDAMDFVLAVQPQHAFGTHDAGLSPIGQSMHRQRLTWATEQHGGTYHVLEPGDSIELELASGD